jgi:fibronectin type 3 domain-containing protein
MIKKEGDMVRYIKRLFAIFILVIFCVSIVNPIFAQESNNSSTSVSSGFVLFEDNFEENQIRSDWQIDGGTWSIIEDSLKPGNKVLHQDHTSQEAFITAGNVEWTDYTVSMKFKHVDGGAYPGILARFQDKNNYYMFRLDRVGGDNNTYATIDISKKVNGTSTTLAYLTVNQYPIYPNVWYTLKIQLKGPLIKCYINDVLIFVIMDNSLSKGKIGIRTRWGKVDIDDVCVTSETDALNKTVSGEPSPNSVLLKWDSVENAVYYRIWRSTKLLGSYNCIAENVTDTCYTDSGLESLKNYYYIISAITSNDEVILAMPLTITATRENTDNVYDKTYILNNIDELLPQHDYIYYYVDCGDPTPTTPDPGDKMGLFQSVTEQAYGLDVTGFCWGYGPETEAGGPSTDKYSSVRFYWGNTHNADTSVSYRFELPIKGYYFVTIATKNPWDTRSVNICLEGVNRSGDFPIPKNTTVEVTYRVYVDDGELNVDIKGPSTGPWHQYNDPMVGFILVEGVIPMSYLQSQISALSTEINKKKEDGSNYYTPLSIKRANEAISDAQAFVNSFNPQTDDIMSENVQLGIREKLKKIKTAFANLVPDIPNTVFRPGQLMRDTDGAVIDAHGGYIMYDKITKRYYWYGEYHAGKWPSSGISCYSSTDLLNWKFEGIVLKLIESREQLDNDPYFAQVYQNRTAEEKDKIFDTIRVGRILERPRVIYNDKTKKYVMWMHVEGRTNPDGTLDQSYGRAEAGVAISDSPTGPFEFLHSNRLDQCPPDQKDYYPASKGMSRDLTLFKDNDGSAYVIYASEENYTLYISKLTEDYTDVVGWHKENRVDEKGRPIHDSSYKAVYGVDYVRIFPGEHREAPAMFKYDGKYYLLTSGCTGWAPNENKYAVADHPFGPWSPLENPFVKTKDTDPDPMKAFGTQTTCVIPVDPENGKFIYVGDIWNGGDFSNDGAKYVFLPIEFGQGTDMIIRWYDSWDLSILDRMAKVNIITKFPEAVALGTVPYLPSTIKILDKGVEKTTPAIWTINSHTPTVDDFSTPGQVTLELKLPEYHDKIIYIKMYVIPEKTVYFVNCSGYATADYKLISSYLQNTLLNKEVVDQAYNPQDENPWGYVQDIAKPAGSESGDIWSTVRYLDAKNMYNSPYGTDLTYKFTLKNGLYDVYIGFNDPWTNLSRKANLIINGEVKGPITFTPRTVQVHKNVQVTNNILEIIVRNTAAQDPLISWIMIVDNSLNPAPDPTLGLTGTSDSPTSIKLSWHKVLGATGYTLYRSEREDGTFVPIYSGNASTYIDTNLKPNKTYYYKISYTNDREKESALSSAISVTTKNATTSTPSTIPPTPSTPTILIPPPTPSTPTMPTTPSKPAESSSQLQEKQQTQQPKSEQKGAVAVEINPYAKNTIEADKNVKIEVPVGSIQGFAPQLKVERVEKLEKDVGVGAIVTQPIKLSVEKGIMVGNIKLNVKVEAQTIKEGKIAIGFVYDQQREKWLPVSTKQDVDNVVITTNKAGTMVVVAANVEDIFKDVKKDNWSYETFKKALSKGLITGYEDMTLRPDRKVSLAEAAVIAQRAFEITPKQQGTFSNVPNWANEAIKALLDNSVIEEMGDINAPLTRLEACKMIIKLLELKGINVESSRAPFNDLTTLSSGEADYIAKAYSLGIVKGYPDNTFRPQKVVTRAELIALFIRAIETLNK